MQLRKESLKKKTNCNCISCVSNCKDLLYIYLVIDVLSFFVLTP